MADVSLELDAFTTCLCCRTQNRISSCLVWLPIIHLVHMGAGLCELHSVKSCPADSTQIIKNVGTFSQQHPVGVNKKEASSSSVKQNVLLEKLCTVSPWRLWQRVSESVYFRAAALEEAESAAGLSGFMRRQAAPKCMAATVYWGRHSAPNLKKTVNGDYSFSESSFLQFSIALFLSLHTSLIITMMKSLFWLAHFCMITFNEQ